MTRLNLKSSRLWLALALLFVIVRSLPNITDLMGGDQATYCVIARGLVHGQKLYRDLWDIKSPGIFWLYAPVVKLFGPVMWSVALLDLLWLLTISICIFRFAGRYAGTATATLAVGVNAAWHCRAGYTHAAQPENFIALLAFAGYFLIWREGRWTMSCHVAAGVLMGAAFWLKYNAVTFVPFLLFGPYLVGIDLEPPRVRLSILWRDWLRRAGAMLAGLAAAILAVLAYFWLEGLGSLLWEEHFRIVRRYAAPALPQGVIGYLVHPFAVAFLGLGPWTVMATAAALVVARKKHKLALLAPVFLGELFGFASAAAQFRVTSYEFETCFPFAAIVWAYLGVEAYQGVRTLGRFFAARGWRLAQALVWTLFAAGALWVLGGELKGLPQRYRWMGEWWHDSDRFYANYPSPYPGEHLEGLFKVLAYLRQNSKPGDTVYVWGNESRIYYFSQLDPPTRFVPNHPLVATWGLPKWKPELVRDLKRSPPAFIVVARNDALYGVTLTNLGSDEYLKVFPELNAFITSSYRAVETDDDFEIYRRESTSAE